MPPNWQFTLVPFKIILMYLFLYADWANISLQHACISIISSTLFLDMCIPIHIQIIRMKGLDGDVVQWVKACAVKLGYKRRS